MIRLHSGDTLSALPLYLPADPAIPVAGIPAQLRDGIRGRWQLSPA